MEVKFVACVVRFFVSTFSLSKGSNESTQQSAVPSAIQHHSYYSSTGNAPSPGTIQANSNVSAPTTATLSHPGSQGMSQPIDSQYTNISVAAAMNHQQ